MREFKKLEDYGIIGSLDTCALVGKDGSIDWCCFPHIESPSIFAGILDINKGGHFVVQPKGSFNSRQNYIKNTNILETEFRTSSGRVTLTDFMPMRRGHEAGIHELQAIYRKIAGAEGQVKMEVDFSPRFDYARSKTTLEATEWGILARGENDKACITSPFKLKTSRESAFGSFTAKEGEDVWMVLQYGIDIAIDPKVCEEALKNTIGYWTDWVHNCQSSKCIFGGPLHDLIVRSGLVLKLLTHHETGAICAAPTTSLPEEIGGTRNWDYRFNWVRDSAFTVQALYNLGHIDEAKKYLKWFMDICKGAHEPHEIQIMYGLHGEQDLEEKELGHLSGYRNSRPVRIGNGAAKQKQLDIYGELLNAFYGLTQYGEDITEDDWDYIVKIVDYVCNVWDTKDSGIWEARSGPKHYVYSKLMCWVAVDRGIKIAKSGKFDVPLKRWKDSRDKIKNTLLKKGFSKKLNSFVQSFDSEILDATSLLIPMEGLLGFDDPRVQATIDATIEGLTSEEGLVFRYKGEDGLPGKEGAFTLCTFWLVNALTLSGRILEAEKIFKSVLKHASPLGLFSEEIDPETGAQLGNFPQAFSHIGLINSALYLGKAKGGAQMGPSLLGGDKK
ncbi:MAG: glycoside hydrolase family 15 protein [Candidatus Hydrothermarchaeaceae archaeon]